MKVTVHIDIDTLEGKQLVEYLKGFPRVITFEDGTLNDLQQVYNTKSKKDLKCPENYVLVEEFRVEAKKRAKAFLEKHGLYQ